MSPESRFWHPFADMAQVKGHEIVIERGQGATVWDSEGNEYFDGTASLWCVNAGHGRSEIASAISAQMEGLATYQTFSAFSNRPAMELADRLAGYAEPLMDEMFRCIQIQPDPRKPEVVRPLIDNGTEGDDIEEVATRLRLRSEVINLHTGFSMSDALSKLTSASDAVEPGSSSTKTSRVSSAR